MTETVTSSGTSAGTWSTPTRHGEERRAHSAGAHQPRRTAVAVRADPGAVEEVVEVKGGKKSITERRMYSGYVLVEMDRRTRHGTW